MVSSFFDWQPGLPPPPPRPAPRPRARPGGLGPRRGPRARPCRRAGSSRRRQHLARHRLGPEVALDQLLDDLAPGDQVGHRVVRHAGRRAGRARRSAARAGRRRPWAGPSSAASTVAVPEATIPAVAALRSAWVWPGDRVTGRPARPGRRGARSRLGRHREGELQVGPPLARGARSAPAIGGRLCATSCRRLPGRTARTGRAGSSPCAARNAGAVRGRPHELDERVAHERHRHARLAVERLLEGEDHDHVGDASRGSSRMRPRRHAQTCGDT